MEPSSRPSKQFIIRGSIATGIVAIILIVQTAWFRALFNKAPLVPINPNETVGDLITRDTNENNIPDWEEKLWGLDPTVLYTDGVPNAEIIAEKKKALGVIPSGMPENETDALARELLTITSALGQSGELSDEALAQVGAQLAESVEFQQYENHFSLKDVRTVQTNSTSLTNYYNSFGAIARKYAASASEIDIIAKALENGDFSNLSQLENIESQYEQYAKEAIALSVPVGVQLIHLEMVNSIYGFSIATGFMRELSTNGANALAGIALYKINDARFTNASEALRTYLTRYGILE